MAWLLDAAGFVTGTYDGPGQPANSTNVVPPANAAQPLQFVGGEWAVQSATATDKIITQFAFLKRMSSTERIKIRRARYSDPVVDDIMALVDSAKYIDLAMDDTIGGVAYLVQAGLLTQPRAMEILDAPITGAERP